MMTMLAYSHASFADHLVDMIVRGFVYRTISVGTRGLGLGTMLLLTAIVVVLAFMWNSRRA